jgi:hypothetical protein
MITTQQQLTTDAQTRNYRPGAIVILLTGAVVQITSWPWYDGEGDNRSARVMVRRYVGDPTTNHEIGYFEIMRHTGQDKPLDEHVFEDSGIHMGCGGRWLPANDVQLIDRCDTCGQERA